MALAAAEMMLGTVAHSFLAHYHLVGLGLLLWLARWLLEQLWWKPQRLQRELRAQGIGGTAYRFPAGDLPDLAPKAPKNPLPLRFHDVAPLLSPLMHSTVRDHGKTSFFWFGPMPDVVISDTSTIKDILFDKHSEIIIPHFKAFGKLVGKSLTTLSGDKWVRHRKIMSPAIHLPELKNMAPEFSACCEELVGRWKERLGSDGCGEVDIWPELQILTGDVLSRALFGKSYLEGMKVFHKQSEIVERLMSDVFITTVPGYMYLPTRNNRRMHKLNKEIESIIQGLIGERIKAWKEGGSTKNDLLGVMVDSTMRGIEENDQSSSRMTLEDIINHCKFLYFGGMEPTADLLTWTIVLLSMHPEWQDKARQEVLGLLGKNKPRYEDMSQLKIVTMVLREVLRLYPPAAQIKRKTMKEVKLGGVRYPAGVMIDIPIILLHHDPENWGSDAHEFNPERFANGISEASKNPGAFIPFGAGPRICVGQNFSMLEGKMAICMILQHFEFELAPAYSHKPHYVLTLTPMHGVQIKIKAI